MRSQRELPDDHPLKNYEIPKDADCVGEIPEEILNQLVLYYEGDEPPGEAVPQGEELV